jgi:hypothetical protein
MPDFINELSPEDIIKLAGRGYDRFKPNRMTAMLTIKNMGGQFYGRTDGTAFQQTLAMSFNAARVLVPNLVLNFPKHVIETPFLPARQFASDLGTALSYQDRHLRVDELYRCVIVDALHSLGIVKTGIASGGTLIELESEDGVEKIDQGQVYSERVSFQDFVTDPDSKQYLFKDARFIGDIIKIPRQVLLDSDEYDHDMVMELSHPDTTSKREGPKKISQNRTDDALNNALEDLVEICELYIPSSNCIVTVPGDFKRMTKFLRISDYYGLKDNTGPYTFLSLTIPVPDNPLPVPFFSVLLDLELQVNRTEAKISNQADRQKDVLMYSPDAADDAALVRDASDGDIISCTDPNNLKMVSFGGQQQSNEEHLSMLLQQYNSFAANVETLSGTQSAAKSATAANILQQNASVVLSDIQDAVYKFAAAEARKRAFYIFNDPFLDKTIVRRVNQPGQMAMTQAGPQWVVPPSVQDVQVTLTPEAKTGEFMDLVFNIQPESMSRVDSKTRLQNEMTFCQQILPAISAAAQIFQTLGVPFDTVTFLSQVAKDMNLTWFDSVVFAPAVQMKAAAEYNAIKAATGQDVPPSPGAPPNAGLNPAMLQNGQPGQVQAPQMNPMQQQNQGAQAGAMDAQRLIGAALRNSLRPQAMKPPLATAGGL